MIGWRILNVDPIGWGVFNNRILRALRRADDRYFKRLAALVFERSPVYCKLRPNG